ncbi:hypothetical protein [Robbsia sp. KACC 23696]|uniref:hypothetical protein n=1 Tax=Robbsia sp. KACC 23696 TaxID=3149231 RepID=UPI00325A529B
MMRIAPALDGGICRIRLPGGMLSAAQARSIAHASRTFGNGIIELTNRANLQLRGIGGPGVAGPGLTDAPADLIALLMAAGLGPSSSMRSPQESHAAASGTPAPHHAAQHADIDAVRNILISPSAGIDPSMRVDTRPLLTEALARLTRRMTHGMLTQRTPLSAKFAIQIDGGEALTVLGHHHDIWFSAVDTRDDAIPGAGEAHDVEADAVWCAFGLASSIPSENTRETDGLPRSPSEAHADVAIGLLRARDVPLAIDALVTHFLACRAAGTARDGEGRTAARLRDVLAASDLTARYAFAETALSVVGLTPWRPDWLTQWRRPRPNAESARHIGQIAQARAIPGTGCMATQTDRVALGLHSALGRVSPTQLDSLAALCQRFGDGTVRVTPWHGVIVPNLMVEDAGSTQQAADAARDAGWIVDADAPITRLHACAGSTGCAKSHADTKADALKMAARLAALPVDRRASIAVHLSGCERRCASAVTREFTLIAQHPGHYDLYGWNTQRHENALLCGGVDIDTAADRILKETA